jgi:hypothetical protein
MNHTMNQTYHFIFVPLIAFVLCVVGCQPDGLNGLVPCSGKILDKSRQPVTEVSVTFVPSSLGNTSRGAGAKTDANGVFTATTESGNGIFPGDYKVKLSKQSRQSLHTRKKRQSQSIRSGLPVTYKEQMGKYASVETSGLKVMIPAKGDKNLEIKLDA